MSWSLLAQLGREQAVAVDEPAQVAGAARRPRSVTRARSRCSGPSRRSASRRSLPRPVEALARAADQQLQVVARVGVERGEELVRVDVGQRVRDLDPPALLERLARRRGRPRGTCPSGRSSRAAARWRPRASRPSYFGSSSSSTTAGRPRARPRRCRRPARRPRARSGPGPGVTAWASASSTCTVNGFSSMSGKRRRWLARMYAADAERRARPAERARGSRRGACGSRASSRRPPGAPRAAPRGTRRARCSIAGQPSRAKLPDGGRGDVLARRRRARRVDLGAGRAASSGGTLAIGPPGRVQVRQLLRLARHVRPVRRRLAAAVGRRARAHAVGRRGRARVEELVVAVGEAALAREAQEAALDLVADFWPCSPARPGSGSRARMNGTSTLFVHADSARVCRAAGSSSRLNATSAGIVRAQLARACRAARRADISRRAWRDERQRRRRASRRRSARPAARRARTRAAIGSASLSDASAG